MNNARYVRELDFARFHFYDRTGIYTNIKAVDGHALQGASSIRYRRTIPIFTAYKVETKVKIYLLLYRSLARKGYFFFGMDIAENNNEQMTHENIGSVIF